MSRILPGANHSIGKVDHLLAFILDNSIFSKIFERGQTCVHGHNIRHKMHKWCLPCAEKIYKNQCSCNISHIDVSHLLHYYPVIRDLPTDLDPHKCWLMPKSKLPKNLNRPRFSALTYKSLYIKRVESLLLSRFIYFMFWGDVGSLTIKRLCKNPICWNPFHLKSSFNVKNFTYTVDPFSTQMDLKEYNEYNLKIKKERKNYKPILTRKDFN